MKRLSLLLALTLLCASAFASGGTFPPSSLPTISGIDVSAWQASIDFAKVYDSGVRIVYIRAGEGTDFTDPYYKANFENARAAGLKTGFYHFMTAQTEAEAIAQARFFYELIAPYAYDCRPAMDFGAGAGLDNATLTAVAQAFLSEIETLTDVTPMLYTDASGARDRYGESLSVYPIWVANYGVSEPESNGKWASWAGFQYSDTGSVAGIAGSVDLNEFTRAVFISSVPPAPTPTPAPSAKTMEYTVVQPGETLSGIADRYGAQSTQVERLNRLPASGSAVVGQVLRVPISATPAPGAAAAWFVSPGESNEYYTALHFGLRPAALRAVNISPFSPAVRAGQILRVPPLTARGSVTAPSANLWDYAYVTQPGDTPASIAAAFSIAPADFLSWNGLRAGDPIYPGQVLRLIPRGVPAPSANNAYVVQRGDTLRKIARRFGSTVDELMNHNDIRNRNLLVLGQVLVIP